MSLFGAIRSAALKVLQPTNRNVLPSVSSNRLLANRFDKMLDNISKQLPPKPKRPPSGYNIFFQELTHKLKAQNPNFAPKDVAKAVGTQWKSLDPLSKQELNDRTRDETEEYNKSIKNWKDSLTEEQKKAISTSNKTRRALNVRRQIKTELKKLEYPSRNLSAFNIFVKQSIIRREQSDEPYKNVFRQFVAKWKTMSDEHKKPYVEAAKADKARYLKELEVWKNKMDKPENKDSLDKLSKMKAYVSDRLAPDTKTKARKVKKPKKLTKPKKSLKAKASAKSKKAVKSKKTEKLAKKPTKSAKKPTKSAKKPTKSAKSEENQEN